MALTPQQSAGKKLGSFELAREVSASSVGATFIATRKGSTESVVLTKVHRHVAKSAQLCENLQNEAKKAVAFRHVNVNAVLEAGTIDGEPFVVQSWTEAESLLSLLRRVGPDGLPVPIALRIALDAASAVSAAYAEQPGFSHGEIGPWCIFVGNDGLTRVSGFGVDRALARFGLHFAKNLDRLPYAAPERVKAMSLTLGPPPAAPESSSDLFSLAVVVWELCTRNKLFASRMEAAVVQKVLSAAIPDARAQREELPEAFSKALSQALSRDPAARGSLEDFVNALTTASPASHADVVEFCSRLVERSQPRPSTAPARAFSSVVPGPASQRPQPPKTNGVTAAEAKPEAPKPPIRGRAQTLMGFALAAPAVPKEAKSLMDDEPTLDLRASSSEIRDSAIEIMLEEPSTQDGNALVETVEEAATAEVLKAAKPASLPPAAPAESPAVAAPKTPSVPPPAPARKRPPIRQHTLMGIEPVALADAASVDAAEATSGSAIAEASSTPSPMAAEAKPKTPLAPRTTAATTPEPAAAAKTEEPAAAKAAATAAANTSTASLRGEDIAAGLVLAGGEAGNYQLLEPVARGGMATVWAARPAGTRGATELVAVKTILPELSDEPDFASMFTDEMRVASRIHHENVARTLACVNQGEAVFLVMEWIDGDTLGALQHATRTTGGIPENILIKIATGICAGLHAAHELKDGNGALVDLIHRDVNPANIMLTRAGVVKIVDFGIAKSKGRVHVTRVGSTVKGKTPYLSPEQLGGIAHDRRSDLFSLGCVLYTMATGVHPFRGESELKTIENIVLKTPANPRGLSPELHPEFERLIMQLLEKDPKKRPADAEAVRAALVKLDEVVSKPASTEDVATFVQKALAEPFRERDASLVKGAGALDQPQRSVPPPPPPPPPSDAAAPASDPFASFVVPSEPLPSPAPPSAEPVSVPTVDPIGVAPVVAKAEPEASPPASERVYEEEPPAPRRGLSPWARLSILIVVGVVAGIAIIALIESMRAKPDSSNAGKPGTSALPTTTALSTSTGPAVAPQPTVPTPTQPTATAEPTAAPTVTAEPTAAEPTATAEPPKPATGPTAKPTGPKPTGPKPTGPKPKPKYNPSTI